jgi:cellulose synthase/poly-beta-1,6-N-acetylglucosamine synthase-like glycosyltransferase
MRNEEKHIGGLLQDCIHQEYPRHLFKVLVVNDHSFDQSVFVVENLHATGGNITLLHLPEGMGGKKAALYYALSHADGELIVTTDADCRLSPRWLSAIAACYENSRPEMIIGPVIFKETNTFFSKWQALEYLSLTGSAAGSASWTHPVMCSAANLAIKRETMLYYDYIYKNTLASGDDMMMMMEIKKNAGQIKYLKSLDATVMSFPSDGLKEFIHQRNRWTSKSVKYTDPDVIIVALIVFLVNFSILCCFFIGLFRTSYLWFALIMWLIKILADLPFLYSLSRFWKRKKLIRIFIPTQLIYPFYIVSTVFMGILSPVYWKGRKS